MYNFKQNSMRKCEKISEQLFNPQKCVFFFLSSYVLYISMFNLTKIYLPFKD